MIRFLLAQLHLESLIDKRRSVKVLRTALAKLPTGSGAYDRSYDDAMSRIEAQAADQEELAKQVLSWITCAKRPLRTSELQEAVSVEAGESQIDKDNIPDIGDIISVCAGLVTVDKGGIIRLIHYTTQEYFERTQANWFPNAESDITSCCITYLAFPTFKSGYSERDEEPPERQHYPLFDYAAKCWVRHAQLGSLNPELISGFLSSESKMPSSCLLWAAQNEEETCVYWLLERGVDANVYDATRKTPLHYAVLHSWPRCVELLLRQGANITADIDNMTPLHYTVSKTSEEMAQCFLDAGVPIDTGVKMQTWRQAYQEGKLRYIPENGFHESGTNVGSHKRLTALHYAALTGCRRMTKFFLDHGADPKAVTEYGETPLHLALKRNLHGVKWPDVMDRWSDPIYRIEGSLDFIDCGPGDEVEYSEMKTMIEEHRSAAITLLLDHELTDVNVKDIYGAYPVHDVMYENSTSPAIIERLIHRRANVSARNHQDQTPLHLACSKGNVDSVIVILEHGADIKASDSKGLNALHYAAQSGKQEITQHLLSHVASVDFVALMASRDKLGRNALHHLVSRSGRVDCAIVQYLLDSGVNVNDLNHAGMSPLATYLERFMLLFHDAPRVARLLLQSGADPSFKTHNGGLGLAHLYGQSCRVTVELLAVLADGGVDLQMEDDESRTVLHQCAIAGSLNEEALHFLCNEGGLLKDSRDAHGQTPLQYAAEMRQRTHHRQTFDPKRWSRTEKILLG